MIAKRIFLRCMSFGSFCFASSFCAAVLAGDPPPPHHGNHEHDGSVIVNADIAALFPKALEASAFLQDEIGRRVPHQGTEHTDGHIHFDLRAPDLRGEIVTYDICPHKELGAHSVMHFAEKRPEWTREIEGYPGFYHYRSFAPRLITEVGRNGDVRPYHGNLVGRIDEIVSAGWASDAIAINIMNAIIAEAKDRGFKYDAEPAAIASYDH